MNFSFFKAILLLATLGSALALPRAAQAAGGIHDDAQFFSPDAVRQGEQIIQHIRDTHKRDVLVQSYPQIPDDLRGDYQSQGKDKFFQSWAERIGKEQSVNGIVILICKDPAHLEVSVGIETRKRAFVQGDRLELTSQFLAGLKSKQYDSALLDGLRFIQDRMDRNLHAAAGSTPVTAAPPSPAPNYGGSSHGGTGIAGWICLAIGVLIVLMLVRAIFNRNRGYGGMPGGYGAPPMAGGYPPGGYPPNYGGGGGGFGRGLLGGLLGGALGSWGYDQMAHRREPDAGYTPNAPPSDSGGADTGSSGGDFGGGDTGSSGGDFGGGGGGGDFGGGGGGDSGASGGDF